MYLLWKKLPIRVNKPTVCNKDLCQFHIANFYKDLYKSVEPSVLEMLYYLFINNKGGNLPKKIEISDRTIPVFNEIVTDLNSNIIQVDFPSEILGEKFLIYHTKLSKELKFQTNKKNMGSFFLFHGTKLRNMYPIIRDGLKVMSGTVMQTAEQLYGQGIYMSNVLDTSIGYTNSNYIFLCEVLGTPDMYKKMTDIYVVPNENDVVVRLVIKLNNKNQRVDAFKIDIPEQFLYKNDQSYVKFVTKYEIKKKISKKEVCPICLDSFQTPSQPYRVIYVKVITTFMKNVGKIRSIENLSVLVVELFTTKLSELNLPVGL